MDDRCAGSVGTPVTSAETVGGELTRWSIKIWETRKSRREEGNAGVINLNPSLHTQCTSQGEQ
jgi:hypothetical protein